MRSSFNLATKPKASSQSIYKNPRHTQEAATNAGNVGFYSKLTSPTYNFTTLCIFWGKNVIILGCCDRKLFLQGFAIRSSAGKATWLFALGWSIRLCSSTNKLHVFNSGQQQLKTGQVFNMQANNKLSCQCQRLQYLKIWLINYARFCFPAKKGIERRSRLHQHAE